MLSEYISWCDDSFIYIVMLGVFGYIVNCDFIFYVWKLLWNFMKEWLSIWNYFFLWNIYVNEKFIKKKCI